MKNPLAKLLIIQNRNFWLWTVLRKLFAWIHGYINVQVIYEEFYLEIETFIQVLYKFFRKSKGTVKIWTNLNVQIFKSSFKLLISFVNKMKRGLVSENIFPWNFNRNTKVFFKNRFVNVYLWVEEEKHWG